MTLVADLAMPRRTVGERSLRKTSRHRILLRCDYRCVATRRCELHDSFAPPCPVAERR